MRDRIERIARIFRRAGGRPPARKYAGRRRLVAGAAFVLTVATGVALWQGASVADVGRTKHNLGALGPGAIKSTETTEICVFCHTPHNALPATAGWNRTVPGDTYNPYASLTMVAAVGQPTGSSKLCLSCHDGTIALGSMRNLPGAAESGAAHVGGAGVEFEKLAPTLAGGVPNPSFIGADLRNDHPVSFLYTASFPSNIEITSTTALPPTVRLDAGGRVQCTSCHNPHGSPFPKFLTDTVENGSLCTACHYKKYWDLDTTAPVHKTATAVWTGTEGVDINPYHMDMGVAGTSDDTPALQSCLACHRSHGGAPAQPLLKGTNPAAPTTVVGEEWLCLNCHTGKVAAKNMEGVFNYPRKHDVKAYNGLHTPWRAPLGQLVTESQTNLNANRHVECADCHNPHALEAGNHAIGGYTGNVIGLNLVGGWGVKPISPSWPAAGTAENQQNYTVVRFNSQMPTFDDLEGYLCLKCHSSYAYGQFPPTVPSGHGDGTVAYQSDITADMNINNASIHPVFAAGKNQPPVLANPNWAGGVGLTNTFRYMDFPGIGPRTGFYNVQHDSKVTCSDCHGPSSALDPQGVHGSANRWMLRGAETGEPGVTPGNFCYNCHRRKVYGDEDFIPAAADAALSRVAHPVDGLGANSPFYKGGPTTGNNSNRFGNLCLTCHGGADFTDAGGLHYIKGAHGSNDAATVAGTDPLGKRMMNGACVESHTHATTTTPVAMSFKTAAPGDKVCRNTFTGFSGNLATYDYW